MRIVERDRASGPTAAGEPAVDPRVERLERRLAALEALHVQTSAALEIARAGEARFRSLIHTAGGVILVVGDDGRIQEANRHADTVFGLAPGGTAGRHWRELIADGSEGVFAVRLAATRAGHELRNVEHSLTGADGKSRTLLWNMNLVASDGSQSVICVGQDITRRKQAEVALQEAHAALEERVDERTRALRQEVEDRRRAERALLGAKEQAETSSRAKGDFLAKLSHELRTPLNAIIGFCGMLEQEMLGPLGHSKYREYAHIIGRSGLHLLSLIGDIIDVARVEAGKFEVRPQWLDLRDVVDAAIQLVRPRADENGVTLSVRISENTPPVLADVVRMQQILLNLLSNAVKFTPAGGRVEIRTGADGDQVVIEVADSGIGMSPEGIQIALQPFGQVPDTQRRQPGGTGLGLPLAVSFVEMHGGTLDVESAEGIGTTVRVRMPAAPGPQLDVGL